MKNVPDWIYKMLKDSFNSEEWKIIDTNYDKLPPSFSYSNSSRSQFIEEFQLILLYVCLTTKP